MPKPIELTKTQARRLALASQGLGGGSFGRGRNAVLAAIRHLGYVQIDTISVIERAHHHTLFNRVRGYRRSMLDRLVEDRSILDYWAHAAAYLPMEDYRFCLPRMQKIAAQRQHWFEHDGRLAVEILARIRAEGPMQASDFESHRGSRGMWDWGPVKRAIEYLFMTGQLLVTRRENFRKVFDLAERVVPGGVDTSTPTLTEYADHLVSSFLRAHGIARETECSYLRGDLRGPIARAVSDAIENGRLIDARIRGVDGAFVVARDFESRLSRRIAVRRVRLLSPFDNLVIQRERVRRLFDFDYQIECYVPRHKRLHGYFVLPVLWRGQLVARLDAKADRSRGVLRIHHLALEPGMRNVAGFVDDLVPSLEELAAFTGCDSIETADAVPRILCNTLGG